MAGRHRNGKTVPLTPEAEKMVSYGQVAFSKDGKGIYFLSDKDYEFKRLAYQDLTSKKYLTSPPFPWDIEGFNFI